MSARKLRIVYSDDAKAELRDIQIYTEQQFGRDRRVTFIRELRHVVRLLAGSPGIGRMRDEILPGIRSHPAKSYVIYYQQLERELFVAHILHEKREASRVVWSLQPGSE